MAEVLSLTAPFFGLILLGFVLGRVLTRSAEGLEWLNVFIIYLALPALLFQLLSGTPFEELSNGSFILATTLSTSAAFAIAFAVALARTRGDVETSTIKALVGSYSNVGYLGPGLAIAALGAEAVVPVALIIAFDNTLFFVITPILMAVGGSGAGGPGATALRILKRIATHPFILAVAAGTLAAASGWQPPGTVDRLLTMLSGAAAPTALFAMGVTVALQRPPTLKAVGDLSVFLSIKLLVHPVIAFAIVSFAGADPVWLATAVIMAALPPATNVFVLATQYRRFIEGASNAVLVGTAVSAVTVTAILYALRSGAL